MFLKMRDKKYQKSINKKEELPSFILNLNVPESIDISSGNKKSAPPYLGPVFFGDCLQFHPPHHSVPLSSFHQVQFNLPSKENVLKDIFLPEAVGVKPYRETRPFHPATRTRKVFADPYAHKCPGVRRIFAPDPSLPEGLGETKSIIEGETSREIPFFRIKNVSSVCDPTTSKPRFEIVTLSDIREEKRNCMSYKEQMAHAHFPKEFTAVRVNGPTIPEAITITKLPSKRKRSFEIDLHLKSKSKKTAKKEEKDKESFKETIAVMEENEKEEKESNLNASKLTEPSVEERSNSDSKRKGSLRLEIEDESEPQQSVVIRDETDDEELEEEVEALEEEFGEVGEGNSQVCIDKEKEDFLEAAEEENQNEAVEN